jgi:hypothetical protein
LFHHVDFKPFHPIGWGQLRNQLIKVKIHAAPGAFLIFLFFLFYGLHFIILVWYYIPALLSKIKKADYRLPVNKKQ